jgi:hypothetical protein
VLRHFGGRKELLEQAQTRHRELVRVERTTPVGDVAAAVRTIVTFYDRTGDWSVRLQAEEHRDERIGRTVAAGRRFHRAWVAEVFAPQLAVRATPADREELVDLLVIATDVLTWKILRRDGRLDQASTCARMLRLVRAVLSELPEGG